MFFLLPMCVFSLCFASFTVTLSSGCGSSEKMEMPDEFPKGSKEEPKIGAMSGAGGGKVEK